MQYIIMRRTLRMGRRQFKPYKREFISGVEWILVSFTKTQRLKANEDMIQAHQFRM